MDKKVFDQVVNLTHFLEKYTQQAGSIGRDKTFAFSKEDQKTWELYFEMLVKSEILSDGMAFGESNNDTKVGIGKDGACYSDEFFQLLMQCYKYLYTALSSGEVFLKYKNWYISDSKEML